MSRLTKYQIVQMGLKIVGGHVSSLQTDAETWLDLVLDEAAHGYRFPELESQHSATIAAGATSLAYPTDYGFLVKSAVHRGAVGYIKDSDNVQTYLFQRLAAEIRSASIVTETPTSPSQYVADDRNNSRWLLDPQNGVSGTIYLTYQRRPVSGLSDAVVWYESDMEMVSAVRSFAEQYMRGNQVALSVQVREAAKSLFLRSPFRMQLWTNTGPGGDLDPRWFR